MATPAQIKAAQARLYGDQDTSYNGMLLPDIVPALLNLIQENGITLQGLTVNLAAATVNINTRILQTDATGTLSGGSATITAGTRYFSIEALEGSFTQNGIVYTAGTNLEGFAVPLLPTGDAYSAITITLANNSRVRIEEGRNA
jgi:hypothetical protein